MPQQLRYVAQLAMDNYYQQYKGEDDYWDLEDFVSMCGNTVSGLYSTFYQQEYAMLRQERKDEVISFDAGWLLEQEAEVQKAGDRLFAVLEKPVMTFPYDQSSSGIQTIFITEPSSFDELERTNLGALWQLKYLPKTNRIFFYSDVEKTSCVSISKLGFINKGNCNIKKIRILYIPSMSDEFANVADGIIADVVLKTVLAMKQMAANTVVDQTADQNSNKILQTELDKKTLIK